MDHSNRKLKGHYVVLEKKFRNQKRKIFFFFCLNKLKQKQCSGDLIFPLRTSCLFTYGNKFALLPPLMLYSFSKTTKCPFFKYKCWSDHGFTYWSSDFSVFYWNISTTIQRITLKCRTLAHGPERKHWNNVYLRTSRTITIIWTQFDSRQYFAGWLNTCTAIASLISISCTVVVKRQLANMWTLTCWSNAASTVNIWPERLSQVQPHRAASWLHTLSLLLQ